MLTIKSNPIWMTPSDEEVAEAYGRDARAQGAGIEGARAYSMRGHIQQAWRRGWETEDHELRLRSVR